MLAHLPARTRDDATDLRRIVVAVAGDMAEPGLGLAAPAASALAASVDIVLHCAASIAFDAPMHTLLATNYEARCLRQFYNFLQSTYSAYANLLLNQQEA